MIPSLPRQSYSGIERYEGSVLDPEPTGPALALKILRGALVLNRDDLVADFIKQAMEHLETVLGEEDRT